jgi:hypothetical protein
MIEDSEAYVLPMPAAFKIVFDERTACLSHSQFTHSRRVANRWLCAGIHDHRTTLLDSSVGLFFDRIVLCLPSLLVLAQSGHPTDSGIYSGLHARLRGATGSRCFGGKHTAGRLDQGFNRLGSYLRESFSGTNSQRIGTAQREPVRGHQLEDVLGVFDSADVLRFVSSPDALGHRHRTKTASRTKSQ